MAFHLGSLGFLTPFEFDNFQEQVTNVLEGNLILYYGLLHGRLHEMTIICLIDVTRNININNFGWYISFSRNTASLFAFPSCTHLL